MHLISQVTICLVLFVFKVHPAPTSTKGVEKASANERKSPLSSQPLIFKSNDKVKAKKTSKYDAEKRHEYYLTGKEKRKNVGVGVLDPLPSNTKHIKLDAINKGYVSTKVFVGTGGKGGRPKSVRKDPTSTNLEVNQLTSRSPEIQQLYRQRIKEKFELMKWPRGGGTRLPPEALFVSNEVLEQQLKDAGGPEALVGPKKYQQLWEESYDRIRKRQQRRSFLFRALGNDYLSRKSEFKGQTIEEIERATGKKAPPFIPYSQIRSKAPTFGPRPRQNWKSKFATNAPLVIREGTSVSTSGKRASIGTAHEAGKRKAVEELPSKVKRVKSKFTSDGASTSRVRQGGALATPTLDTQSEIKEDETAAEQSKVKRPNRLWYKDLM